MNIPLKEHYRSPCFLLLLLLVSCTGIPEGVEAVKNFEAKRYMGKWYEIARLDNRFEKGLDNISAEYSESVKGGINVFNKGYDFKRKEWKSVSGIAYFIGSPNVGRLEVSFFRPFYSSYNIIDIDSKKYSYAIVCSYNKSYLWILSRTKKMDKKLLSRLVAKADKYGFETDKLIYVKQNLKDYYVYKK